MDDILVDLDREEHIVGHLQHSYSGSKSAKDLQVNLPDDHYNHNIEVSYPKKTSPTTSDRFKDSAKKRETQGHSINSKESAIVVFNKDNISEFQAYVDDYINQNKSLSASQIQKSDRPSEFNTAKKKA